MFPEGRILDFVIVGIIALIVVGPKDLPILMRRLGEFVAKMRAMAAEFRVSFDEMARQSELDDLRREVQAMRAGAPLQAAVGLGKDSETQQVFDEIHAGLRGGDAQLAPPVGYGYPASFEPAQAESAPDLFAETPPDATVAPAPPTAKASS